MAQSNPKQIQVLVIPCHLTAVRIALARPSNASASFTLSVIPVEPGHLLKVDDYIGSRGVGHPRPYGSPIPHQENPDVPQQESPLLHFRYTW